ncbi:hypothetical protein Rxyl_2332 [Rubrobacter xylanophilus DSM 9941]|uniref:Uncharacterized protein n=1 Tax=Rubrobacter xylanophilus (strain DSM 9941 / JCM 11954 / NBRC 16129 / PRD-1) TaxID=266117 RepID=Q1ATL8_RUBXD|nr:hypothetical protein [Rubrobacter xylanophilus]ABG05260.1 hypothetical protein Rxyl_2332 [Rubrobacter xylanophilus DSM 9941]
MSLRRALERLLPGRGGLALSWSPGAYSGPGEELSPLYAFFEVANEGREPVELVRLYLAPEGEGPLGGAEPEGPLPLRLAPGESAAFRVRAGRLARALAASGHRGRPRVRLVAVDGRGREHALRFRYRVDEYLSLRDE